MSVEILKFDGEGYKPIVDFNSWRVAFLNPSPVTKKGNISYIERHMETDEVFVLLEGTAFLIHAGRKKKPDKPNIIKMKKNLIYNVKKASWHAVIMNKNSKILIVENRDTSKANSEYFYFDEDKKL